MVFNNYLKLSFIIFFLAIFPIFFLPIFAQQTSDVLIFTQVTLRDSQGSLVTSFEPTRIGYHNIVALQLFLDEESTVNDPTMNIGGKQYQIIERAATLDFNSENVISDTTLNTILDDGQLLTLVRLVHDGMPVTSGDELTTIWTFIRPLN